MIGAGWHQWGGHCFFQLMACSVIPSERSRCRWTGLHILSTELQNAATSYSEGKVLASLFSRKSHPFHLGPPVRRGAKGRSVHVCLCLGTKNRLVTKLASPWGPSSPILFLGPVSQRKGPCPRGLAGGN